MWSEASKEKLRERNRKNWKDGCFATPEYRKKLKDSIEKSWENNEDRKKRISIITKNEWKKEESPLKRIDIVEKRKISLSKAWSSNDKRYKQKIKQKEVWSNQDKKEEARIRSKNNFKNENYIEKLKAGLKIKPNKPEKILDKILSELFPNSYKYVGNFEIWIGGKNPDFICENRKKIIEFFGTYYHEESHEDIRTSHFLKYGYQTLIIWEDEIENIEEVKRRIKEFHGE
jgi:very-short-patch-repair endonuclease